MRIHSFVILPHAETAASQDITAEVTNTVAFHHSKVAAHGGYMHPDSAGFTPGKPEGLKMKGGTR